MPAPIADLPILQQLLYNEDIDITIPAGEGEVLIGLRLQSTRGKLRTFNWKVSGDIYAMKNAASIKIA